MQLISHCHSFPHVNALTPFALTPPGCLTVKTLLSTPELKTPLPGHRSLWVCSSPGSGYLCLPSLPSGAFFIPLGLQHSPHQAGALPTLLWL